MGRKPKAAEVRVLFFAARASGATLRQAAAAAGVWRTTGHYWLAQSGGVRPRVTRPRPPLRLSLDEREAISRGLAAKKTFTAITSELGRSVSTVSREVARNRGPNGYRAVRADRLAVARTARPRAGKLADLPTLRGVVEDKLKLCWSPQQISRYLERTYPHDPVIRVSHETIYTSLFVQTEAVLRGELTAHLRTRRVRRRPQRRTSRASRRNRIRDMLGIGERPAEVRDRAAPGHWEGDLIVGRYGRSHLVTLVERHSRFLRVIPVPEATTTTVVTAVAAAFLELPEVMRSSLTWDRGVEMTRHVDFTLATGVPVYFCDAYCPWQRGSNENTNGLLRQYLPKKTDLSLTSPAQLRAIVDELNQRPRRTLAWKTPQEVSTSAAVAITA